MLSTTRRVGNCVLATVALAVMSPGPAEASTAAAADLSKLSIEELGTIQVTSVSKRGEPLSDAASSIYVITGDDIARSGAVSLPEILRLAPNLQVTQTSASGYVITARGFNGNPGAQSFSNKLLVLIDGRSVYTPLFSGVYWDMQDVLPQDIERIEVISGPGATLWGANAVNGVINIITRSSNLTQGGLVDLRAGSQTRQAGVRYGGRLGGDVTYRLYARALAEDDTRTAAGGKSDDAWSRFQGGFRMDWAARPADLVTLQGDAYRGSEHQAGAGDENIGGRNLLARWTHTAAGGAQMQAQAYYDRTERATAGGGGKFTVNTWDFDTQDSFDLGSRQQIVLGGGMRSSRYRISGTPTLFFNPGAGDLDLANLFAQDTIALAPTVRLTLGLKVEKDPHVRAQPLPNVRLAWSPTDTTTVWAAASKAVRSPTPFDRDVVEKLGPSAPPQLVGNRNFRHEKLSAFEAGLRLQPSALVSFSLSTFFNDYDQLRSIELSPGRKLPLVWGNLMEGSTHGAEAWAEVQATSWWRLSAGVSTLREALKFAPGSIAIIGPTQAGIDPKYQASLKSSMDLGSRFTLDGDLRYVSALPTPGVPAYLELNGRFGWNLNDQLQLAVSGRNLLQARHVEYLGGAAVPRSVIAELQWRF